MTVTLDRDETLAIFHESILAALDVASRLTFDPPRNDAGASDADLPRLFKAIDAHVDSLAARYNVHWRLDS